MYICVLLQRLHILSVLETDCTMFKDNHPSRNNYQHAKRLSVLRTSQQLKAGKSKKQKTHFCELIMLWLDFDVYCITLCAISRLIIYHDVNMFLVPVQKAGRGISQRR